MNHCSFTVIEFEVPLAESKASIMIHKLRIIFLFYLKEKTEFDNILTAIGREYLSHVSSISCLFLLN